MDENVTVKKNFDAFASLTVNIGSENKYDNSQNRETLYDNTDKKL